jgi:Ras-related protein Rab-1A
MSEAEADFLIQIVMVGDSGGGKTNLVLRWIDDTFTETHQPTIGVSFRVKSIPIDGKIVTLQIWDTNGCERFHSLAPAYYRQALGVLLVYDITCAASFDALDAWLPQIRDRCPQDVIVLLIGNKTDLNAHRCISSESVTDYAQRQNLEPPIEASAKKGDEVDRAFTDIARAVVDKLSRKLGSQKNGAATIQRGIAIGGRAQTQSAPSACAC